MAIDYNIFKTAAQYGETMTLVKVTSGGAYNPATGQPTATTTSYTFKGFFTSYMDDTMKGTVVVSNFRKVIIPAKGLSVAPASQDKVTIDSVTYTITGVHKVTFSDTPVGYICQVQQ